MKNIFHLLKQKKINFIFYFIGIFILGLGVNIMKASTLGAGAWDTVTINLRSFLTINLGLQWVTLGMVSFTISFILMIIVLSYRKKASYILMIFPILFVSLMIDFWNIIVFQDRFAELISIQILFYIIGTLILPLGLALVVKSGFPAFVFDELMLMLVKVFKANQITYVRLGIEFTGILIGFIFGYISMYHLNGTFGATSFGSILFAFTISPIMAYYYKILKIEKRN